MTRIVIANAVSLCAAIFMCLSGLSKSRSRIFFFQFLECVALIVSQLIFIKVAGAISMGVGAVRNYLASKNKLTFPLMLVFFIAIGALGIALNTGGAIGLIPVFASLIFTLTSFYLKGVVATRIAVIFNLTLWVVYSVLIFDLVSAACNFIALTINVFMLIGRPKRA